MSTSLIKTFTQFSILKQHFNNIVRQRQFIKHNVSNVFVTYNQYDYYHTTSVYFTKRKQKVKEEIAPKITKRKLPVVDIWKNMTVAEVADVLQRDINHVLTAASLTDNQKNYYKTTVFEDIAILASTMKKLGFRYKIIPRPDEPEKVKKDYDVTKRPPPDESVLINRRPVVTIMGHVDHGKTTLLDALRNTSVVDTEFGGITQHIGAFNVELQTGEKITFLDTPGHAAFTSMRERGAQITDIVVLVVAADDGVMEQTVQSINMAKAANVPIIVAINKIDKYDADIQKTQKMLQDIEAIALQAEIMGLKGDPTGLVEGVVIECRNDITRGKLSTALIQRGTLKKGAILVSGTAWAKVRSMFDHAGKPIIQASLSDAVQIMGWRELPNVGNEILEVESEQIAHTVIRYRQQKLNDLKAEEHKEAADLKLEEHLVEYKQNLNKKRALKYIYLPQVPKKKEVLDLTPTVNIVIKADVAGSVEAILDVIGTYTADEICHLNVVHYGVGPVTESDVELAAVFNAIIYRFNVNIPSNIQETIKEKDIPVRPYNVIYKLIDDIKNEINLKLPLADSEEIIGEAKVLKPFEITVEKKKVNVAGCICTKGTLKKNELYRLVREGEVIYTGKLLSMRHIKNEVESIKTGIECGLRLDNNSVIYQPGDILVCFKSFKEKQTIDWNPGF
ncbi:hypothetical protein KPH14_012549 [Odynerus spinipes]|uniref:Tr-type G domain-containing protein n=1 Tax=Odynerus spinipes TaxID=1348599 RepID=A0AAD9RID5_9HYME|nr:hypothetical protein KPH14_012549 [Odynerus spinipes]